MKQVLRAAVTALVLLISLTGCVPKEQPAGDYPYYPTEEKMVARSVGAVHGEVVDTGSVGSFEDNDYVVQRVRVIASTTEAIGAGTTIKVTTGAIGSPEAIVLPAQTELVIFLGQPLNGVYQLLTPFQAVFEVKDGRLIPTGDPDIPLTTQRLGLR